MPGDPPTVPDQPNNSPRTPLADPVSSTTHHGTPRLLITAGPTHEPIDSVRYIGNRSSGRLGIALAEKAASRGCPVTLLLGPTSLTPSDSRISLIRFRTAAELQAVLAREFLASDILIMAAAVADYRPKIDALAPPQKLKRGGDLTLILEPTPDLLAGIAASRKPGQVVIGFALEPRDRLLESARDKLRRKSVDLIVANPLETMESDLIEAAFVTPSGEHAPTAGTVSKAVFADVLLDTALDLFAAKGVKA